MIADQIYILILCAIFAVIQYAYRYAFHIDPGMYLAEKGGQIFMGLFILGFQCIMGETMVEIISRPRGFKSPFWGNKTPSNDIVEARKLAIRIMERNRCVVLIAQVDRYDNNAYPWQNIDRGHLVGYVRTISYGKHRYQIWVPQNGQQKKVMYRNGNLCMAYRQFEDFMEFHIQESLEFRRPSHNHTPLIGGIFISR